MLDAGALDPRRELAADLLGELGSDLVAEKGGDVFGFDGQDGLPGKLFIEGFEDGWRAEHLLAEVYTDPKKRTKLKPEAIWEIEGSLKLSALDIWRASVGRTKIYHAFRRAFERYDFLA